MDWHIEFKQKTLNRSMPNNIQNKPKYTKYYDLQNWKYLQNNQNPNGYVFYFATHFLGSVQSAIRSSSFAVAMQTTVSLAP